MEVSGVVAGWLVELRKKGKRICLLKKVREPFLMRMLFSRNRRFAAEAKASGAVTGFHAAMLSLAIKDWGEPQRELLPFQLAVKRQRPKPKCKALQNHKTGKSKHVKPFKLIYLKH